MTVLIDTNVFLWSIAGEESKISRKAFAVLSDPSTDLVISAASLWEIVLKVRAGKLELPEHAEFFQAHMAQLGINRVLPIESVHVLCVLRLPDHHRDPFDRLLIAQARLNSNKGTKCAIEIHGSRAVVGRSNPRFLRRQQELRLARC